MPVKSQPSSTQLSYTASEPASHNLGLSAHSWNASWPHRALYTEKKSAVGQHWMWPSPGSGCCICVGTAIPGCTWVATAELERAGILSSSLPVPHFSVQQKGQTRYFFSNCWRQLRHAFSLIIKYTFSFQCSGSQEPKFKLEHWNSHGLNHQWDTSGAEADVPSLDLFGTWTVLGPHATELPSASFPVPASCSNQHCLQQMCHM